MEARIEHDFDSEAHAEACIQATLHTLAFRDENAAKLFIKAIYYCRNQSKRNLKTLAQTLESNIRTVFNSSHKYIYELLQNADDVGATEVDMNVHGNTFLFSHSGSHFRPADVEKICDNAQSRGNKDGEIDKTGYKGVGFKANFCISNKITVLSEHVCFRFDQGGFEQPEDYPWPIMPIWTDKNEFLSSLNPRKVHFYLEHITEEKVRREIEEIFASPEVLLLLRHISCVTLHHLGLKIIRVKEGKHITIQKIQHGIQIYEQQYMLYEYPIPIPAKQKEYLSRLPPSECPEKLKIAPGVNISFAVRLDPHGVPMPSKEARLYAYLPTDIRSDLPFWINTEFLLKQDRGQLLDNAWNQYLIYEIGRLQFEVLRSIAQDPATKHAVLRLLPVHTISNHQLAYFKAAYQSGFENGFNTVAFIPSIGTTLLRRDECVIDEPHFFNKLSGGSIETPETRALFNNLFVSPDKTYIVDHHLGSTETLKRTLCLPAEKLFSAQDLVAKLAAYITAIRQNSSALKKLWSYLIKAEGELLKALNTTPWLLLQSGTLQISSKCFLSTTTDLDPDLNELDVIDERIFPPDMRGTVTAWLLTCLSVAQITLLDVIKIHYPKLILEKKVNKHRAIRMLLNIYHAYMSAPDASVDIIRQLGEIFPIEIGTVTLTMNQCMIPNVFLESNQPTEAHFLERIPNDYFPQAYRYDLVALRALLILMGVRTELTFIYHDRLRIDRINKSTRLNQYIAYCQNEYLQITSIFVTASHEVEQFFDCDFIDKISLPGYKEIFWRLMVKNFVYLSQASYFAARQGSISIVSPIVFYLKNYPYLKAKNREGLYPTNQLYTPAISQAYETFPLPVADIPGDIPNEILHALGFKTCLTFEDAMVLLENKTYRIPKMLQFIYRAIISAYEKTSHVHQDRIDAFLSQETFLTTQGGYKKHSYIYWLDMHSEPSTETYFFIDPCGLSFDEMRNVAQIFKLKSFSRESLDTLAPVPLEQPHDAEEICQKLKLKLRDFLPMATIFVAIQNGIHSANIDEIARDFYQKLCTLTLTCYDDLCFAFERFNVSDAEFGKEKVVIKDHEILFTKQAFDNEAVSLNDALANRMFASEELKKLFSAYMDKPHRIRHQELEMKKRGATGGMLAQAKLFFDAPPSVFASRKQPVLKSIVVSNTETAVSTSAFGGLSGPSWEADILPGTRHIARQTPPEGIGDLPTFWNVSRPDDSFPLKGDQLPSTGMKEIEKTTKNIETGRQGELRFYQYLYEQTQKMFPTNVLTETATGYAVYDSNDHSFLNVVWFNKEGEQRKAMDFQVDYQGQTYIFEVKTTQGRDMHAFISSSEIKKLEEYKDNYALVFVFGNGNIHIRWNPYQKISNKILELIPTQYQLSIDTNRDLEWASEEHPTGKGCLVS